MDSVDIRLQAGRHALKPSHYPVRADSRVIERDGRPGLFFFSPGKPPEIRGWEVMHTSLYHTDGDCVDLVVRAACDWRDHAWLLGDMTWGDKV